MEQRPHGVTSPLGEAFVEDHKHLIQGFAGLKEALERGDLAASKRIADELDREAGPHIRFEEEILYPRVAEARGRAYADQLYEEHGLGRDVIRWVLERLGDAPPEPQLRDRLIAGAQTALDHAISCGTLLSHLTTLAPDVQTEFLDQLQSFRREPVRWTDLPERGDSKSNER